jgi:hypothetical protein
LSINKQYTKEIKDEINYSATWLPTIKVSPGDVGRFTDYQYEHQTTLRELGIPFEKTNGKVKDSIDYSSANAVSIDAKAAGQAPLAGSSIAQAAAGVSIKFKRENAIIFRLSGCRSNRIKDENYLREEILSRYKLGNWDDSMVVVTEAIVAEKATILISSGKNSQIDLQVHGKVNAPAADLASIDANFQISKESDIAMKIIASENLTPLFKAHGIRKHFLREPTFGGGPTSDEEPGVDVVFNEVDYGDFVSI